MSVFYTRLAGYYDALYSSKDYKSEAESLHDLIQTYKESDGFTLLDAACGTGGHVQYLRKHYKVWGIDVSQEMLEIARSKFDDVEFRHDDMTRLSFDQQFDVIICLFGSINYLTTSNLLREAMRCFADATVQGGVVIVEPLFTAETVRNGAMGILCLDEADYKLARINQTRVEGDIAYLDFHFLLATRQGIEHIMDPSPMGIFSRAEIVSAMSDVGYRVVDNETGLGREVMYIGVRE